MSTFRSTLTSNESIGNMALMPLKQTSKVSVKGVAPVTNEEDIVDQSIDLFKANILFKSYEMKSNVDRVQVYLTLYIVDCLKRLQKSPNLESAINDMYSMSIEPFALPGDKAFPLNAFFVPPKGSEVDRMKKYLTQLRNETGSRLAAKVFDPTLSQDGKPSKWWTCWAKRRFLDLSLESKGRL